MLSSHAALFGVKTQPVVWLAPVALGLQVPSWQEKGATHTLLFAVVTQPVVW
jgi:hypothetical protein